MTLIIKPFYQKLVPNLSADENNSLKESIKLHGLWLPIVINQKDEILDGHHRYKICSELGVKVKTITRNFASDEEETIFVGECNLKRRQLTSLQKINLVSQLEPYYAKQAEQRMKSGKKADPREIFPQGKVRDVLGKKAGVSGKTYEKGTKVLQSATKEDIEEINAGTKTITSVYEKIAYENGNHFRNNLKKPYSISLHEDLIRGIKHYKRTFPENNLDQQIEEYIETIVPVMSVSEMKCVT